MNEQLRRRADRLSPLTESAPGTPMGTLLRSFWQPVAVAADLAPGSARAIRVMHEDLTLFRSPQGVPYLVGGRCAHRCTVLHTGWIEGDAIRCMYHGWTFDGATGACTERPAERTPPDGIRIAAYPLHEYGGLLFAYLGAAPAPPFALPRKDVVERDGWRTINSAFVWDCNWFQQVENSLDAVHVSFVHVWGSMSRFGEEISTAIPTLDYHETSAGLRQIATRSEQNVRISDWTFPNNNHVVEPGPRKGDPWTHTLVWAVPIDDESAMRFFIFAYDASDPEYAARVVADRSQSFDPPAHYQEMFEQHRLPQTSTLHLLQSQDYVAIRGQGTVVDRSQERLGASDAGIALLRRIFLRELDCIVEDRPTKTWTPLEASSDLPIQRPDSAAPEASRHA